MILLLLLQAATTTVPTPVTRATSSAPAERFSILAAPCGRASGETVGNDVVVCGGAADLARLPLPDERGPPDRAMPSNPELTPRGALAAEGTPCAGVQRGCTVGFGQPVVMAAIKGLASAVSDGIADARVKKARRNTAGKRIAIPLN